ncbi:uncharacterized protein STEHIDRAFT_111452 [Stereum hirsutum FP-91666 SS1]|uniref:uncharacterized protein n=1 Tax=Stereum hirsutum (strain FP-91666) TaxID=721885 RepID=UPI00044498CE|nr:uncharacterized protein STEHIDRAFT_111452 [Stereum hirsutum FP-91666 SS1]EIM85841.1 hypothetical protein STEHIDRAFT_111452 [Stereum hirsutum FP-91666 SS1]
MTVVAPIQDLVPAPNPSIITMSTILLTKDTYLLNVAVQDSSTNLAALHTDAELRVTNPRGRKKPTRTGPVDSNFLTGHGNVKKRGSGGGKKRKEISENDSIATGGGSSKQKKMQALLATGSDSSTQGEAGSTVSSS